MSHEIQKPMPGIRDLLQGEQFRHQVAMALPQHLAADTFVRVALTATTRQAKLLECTQQSFFRCLMDLASFGLVPDGRHAHLIPYGKECTLVIDYKGLIALAKRSGEVKSWSAELVCEKDQFAWRDGKVSHEIDWRDTDGRGAVQCVYSRVELGDGMLDFEVMTMAEVEAIRKRSKAGNSGPWITDFNEMAKKGLALDTPIPTPFGWATMGTIKVGDTVFDMNGNPTAVIGLSRIKNIQCFKVTFTNGDHIICDDEHRWLARCGGPNACLDKYSVHTVNELLDAKIGGLSVTIPPQGALQLADAELPIDPYLFGYWLGDGTSGAAAITSGKDDVEHITRLIRDSKYTLGKVTADTRNGSYCVRIKDGFLNDLRTLGVLSNKHIPSVYLRGSIEQRTALLQGLMDSDGHIDIDRGRAHFYNTNKRIADGVYELVASLGDTPHAGLRRQQGFGVRCEAWFVGWKPSFCPALLKRKSERFQARKISKYRAIASVEAVASVPTRCIAVASDTKTYLAGKSMAITHNTVIRRHSKRLTLSAEFHNALDADDDRVVERNVTPAAKPTPINPFASLAEAAQAPTAAQAFADDDAILMD